MDTLKEESLKNFNSLLKSEKVALCLYWFELKKKGTPSYGLINFISSFQDRACIFDVPDSLIKNNT